MSLDDSGHDCGTKTVRVRHTDASWDWSSQIPTRNKTTTKRPRAINLGMHVSRGRVVLASPVADARSIRERLSRHASA